MSNHSAFNQEELAFIRSVQTSPIPHLFYLIGICGKIFLSDKDNIFALLAYGAKQNWWLRFWSTVSICWRKYGPHTIINRVSTFLCYFALIWPAIQSGAMSTVEFVRCCVYWILQQVNSDRIRKGYCSYVEEIIIISIITMVHHFP